MTRSFYFVVALLFSSGLAFGATETDPFESWNRAMFAFNQKTERQEEKIYKLESELDDMKKQVASASKLRGEFNTLMKELASAKREINSYKVLNARLDKLERLLSIQTASLN